MISCDLCGPGRKIFSCLVDRLVKKRKLWACSVAGYWYFYCFVVLYYICIWLSFMWLLIEYMWLCLYSYSNPLNIWRHCVLCLDCLWGRGTGGCGRKAGCLETLITHQLSKGEQWERERWVLWNWKNAKVGFFISRQKWRIVWSWKNATTVDGISEGKSGRVLYLNMAHYNVMLCW